MEEMKERMKKIKIPALTKNDWIARMFFYNNKFDKKFYSLLLALTKYLEFDASERAYEYHFNIKHSQRFVDNIDTKSEYSYETFKLAITKVYIGTIVESEVEDELRLDVLLKWDAGLEKDKEYQTIAQNLYNSYCLNIAINKAKSQGPISIFSTEVNYAEPIGKLLALTKEDFVKRMKAYDNNFSEKFYILLFNLEDYMSQAAEKVGFAFYPSIRHAQRFTRSLKSDFHYADFEEAIKSEYINIMTIEKDIYPKFYAQLFKENEDFNILMKHLYDTYLEDCKEKERILGELADRFLKPEKKKVESTKTVAHVPTEISDEIFRKVAARFGKPEKKEEEKKDMKVKEIKAKIIIGGPTPLDLDLKALQKEFGNIKTPKNGLPTVKRICINKDTNMTMLQFSNGDSISVYRDPEDQEDLEKAVAIAMVKYAWGYLENEKAMKRVVNATKKPKNKKKPGELEPKKKKVARRKSVEETLEDEIPDLETYFSITHPADAKLLSKDKTPKKTTHRKPGPKKSSMKGGE